MPCVASQASFVPLQSALTTTVKHHDPVLCTDASRLSRAFRGPLRSVQTRHIAFDRSFDQSFFSLLCVFKEQGDHSPDQTLLSTKDPALPLLYDRANIRSGSKKPAQGRHLLTVYSSLGQKPWVPAGFQALEVRGFEPLTYGLQSHRSSQLSYTPDCSLTIKRSSNSQSD